MILQLTECGMKLIIPECLAINHTVDLINALAKTGAFLNQLIARMKLDNSSL